MNMLLLIIVLLLLFGGGGGYYGYSRWGPGGGVGIVGLVRPPVPFRNCGMSTLDQVCEPY